MNGFLRSLAEQRWDDHRYYHHSRINQALHLLSALSFLCSYALLFTHPVAAGLVGWLLAMTSRQIGHFFFEPKGYDYVNRATHAYKEEIKVGYNLQRKAVLLSAWAISPLVLYVDPSFFGLFAFHATRADLLGHLSLIWIGLGGVALLFRTVQLCLVRDVRTGLVWITKIMTDPFHDIMLYHKAPLYLLRGELLDPMPLEQPPG